MKETDWELKDRRIAWMNINTACSTILAARINVGLVKHKTTKEDIDELLKAISIEYEAFFNIPSEKEGQTGEGGTEVKSDISSRPPLSSVGSGFLDQTSPVSSSLSSPKEKAKDDRRGLGKHFCCDECRIPISIEEKDYSEKWYNKALCRKHQKEYRERRDKIENANSARDVKF